MAVDQHHRRGRDQHQRADDLVEQPFHHDVPVRDRLVEHVEHRDVADVGVGARAEAQLVGMCRQADVDRQHPQLLQHLQDARFRRDRQREDHQVDAGAAREFDQIVDRAELEKPGHHIGRAFVAAIVERADDADVTVALRRDRVDQRSALLVGADDDGAPFEAALLGPAPHHEKQRAAEHDQHDQPGDVERAEPDARELVAGLGEERDADDDQEHDRPGRREPEILFLVTAEGLHLVDVGSLERERRNRRDRDDGEGVVPLEAVERDDIGDVGRKADQHHQTEFDQPNRAGKHDRRIGRRGRLRCDRLRGRRQRARCRAGRLRRRARRRQTSFCCRTATYSKSVVRRDVRSHRPPTPVSDKSSRNA